MSEAKNVRISVTLPSAMVEDLDRATEKGTFTRSDVISEFIRAAREQQKFRRDVTKARKSALNLEVGEPTKVLFSLTENDANWLDGLVEKSGTSRSEVLASLVVMQTNLAKLLNSIGMTAIRRRRISRVLGIESDIVDTERKFEDRKKARKRT